MDNDDWNALLAGANEERLLCALAHRIRRPRNDAQRVFRDAWDAAVPLHRDGFEMLVEQESSPSAYAEAFDDVGMPRVKPIFDRVIGGWH